MRAVGSPKSRPRPRNRPRLAAGVGALLTALVVGLFPLPQNQARAATAEDTAATSEGSAVTKTGAKGPYDDFSKLNVTVHQTKNLRGQGVKVTWTGGAPGDVAGGRHLNFLQIMQCWGDDASAGPDRSQCEFGTEAGATTFQEGLRTLPKGSDPLETQYTDDSGGNNPFVPFRPVEGNPTTTPYDHTYFGPEDTNSVAWAPDDTSGGGEAAVEVKSSRESPHLGCGARTTTSGAVRPCWLVVIPRGTHDPDGSAPTDGALRTSALSQSNWNQRLVFRMDFLPVGDNCTADKTERRVIGSEMVTDAITSWQSALCEGSGSRFTFTQSGEEHAREQITQPTASSPGLAFTVDPVRPPDGAAPVVHAPVVLGGLAVGFFWEIKGLGGQMTGLRLNPRLLAKLLTESYVRDVRLINSASMTVPDHLKGNPQSITVDPEFLQLNPQFKGAAVSDAPLPVMVTSDNSDVNRVVWNYLQSDTDARNFLKGVADPWGTKVNPYFKELNLATDTTRTDFPKTDPTTTELTGSYGKLSYDVIDLGPYVLDMHTGALKTRRGNTGGVFQISGDNPPALIGETLGAGQRKAYSLTDAASADRYQLDVAALENADGEYVRPTSTTLLKAAAQMPDSAVAGVKAPAPAKAKDGAYPLTVPVYAAASTDQPKAARQDYARLIRYAAGAGQIQGTDRGELPLGYAPLPASWRTQAQQAADTLERGVTSSSGPSTGADSGGTGSSGGSGGDAGAAGGAAGSGGAGAGTSGSGGGSGGSAATDNPDTHDTAHPSAAPTDPAKVNVAKSGGITPSEVLGVIRWVLLAVLVAGGAAALAGPVMLRYSVRDGTRRAATAAGAGPGAGAGAGAGAAAGPGPGDAG
ncbi:hypothetical protein [Streptomyces sp. YIM S03343]